MQLDDRLYAEFFLERWHVLRSKNGFGNDKNVGEEEEVSIFDGLGEVTFATVRSRQRSTTERIYERTKQPISYE